jgi:hypothetical protein
MGGELPTYRCDARLASCVAIPLAVAGFSPVFDSFTRMRRRDDHQRTCMFCGRIGMLPWSDGCCPHCGMSHSKPDFQSMVVPQDWRALGWDVSVGDVGASLIFDLRTSPTVSLLSDSDVLYPTLDRILFASGSRASKRYLDLQRTGFTKLIRFGDDATAVRSVLGKVAPDILESRFEPPAGSRILASSRVRHERPVNGYEVELGPAIDPATGGLLAYIGIWVDENCTTSLRARIDSLERAALRLGGEIVDPVCRDPIVT